MVAQKWVTWTLIFLIILAIAWLGWRGASAAGQARLALADLDRIQVLAADPSPEALPALRADLAALETHLMAARTAARPFLWLAPELGWLPEVGPSLRAVPTLLDMAIALAGGGREALDALIPVADLWGQPGEGDLLARAVPTLASAAPGLAAADARLAQAEALRGQVASPLHPKIADLLARLDRYLPLARAGLRAAQAAPALLGGDSPRTYLILAQNDHELRGTGGFISGVGVVRLEAGRITDLKLADSYAVDNLQQPHPAPPEALSRQMGIQLLLLRDSNWSPDFPTSAQVARALFQQDQGVATDGAMAIDLEAVRLLVVALEPLEVPGMAGPITGANVIDQMKQAWAAPTTAGGTLQEASTSDWWARRKDFMGELVAAALTKLRSNSLGQGGAGLDPVALARALLEMLDGRHLQIAVDDPALAGLLAEQGWDGGLRPPAEGDFLAAVDGNVGFNKANAAVRPELDYRVEPIDAGLAATLTITYTHTAPSGERACDRTPRYGDSYDEMIARCYWDYLRVYVPGGSELLEAEGLDGVTAGRGERDTTVFAGAFVLKPGEQHTVVLRYRLPSAVPSAPYRLAIRKQAGALAPPLRVAAGACRWETDLSRDRAFLCEVGVEYDNESED